MAITGSPSAIPETDEDRSAGSAGRESARFSPEADIDGGTAGSTARWTLAGFPVAIVLARADAVAAWDRRLAMGDALDITIRHERGVVIAAVTGGVDIFTVALLRECLFELADSGRTLIVDLNRVTFIDSAALGALIGAARRAAAHGGSLHAVCARPPTRRLLCLTGVDHRIPLAATVDGALMFLAASRDARG